MQPTTIGALSRVAVIAAGLAFAFFYWLSFTFDYLLPLSGTVAVALLILDSALAIWAFQLRNRLPKTSFNADGEVVLLRARNPLSSLLAARTAALALAASRTGAVLGGAYLGIAAMGALQWRVLAARELSIIAALTALAALGLVVVGLWLERLCRLPNPRP